MSVEMEMVYQGDLRCVATHGPSGQTLTTDAPVDNGGKGQAFSPTDLVGTALGTCVLTLMGLAANRGGLDITGAKIRVAKEMASAPLRRIASLKLTVTVPGASRLSATDRLKLERAAQTCPVKQSLHSEITVQMEFVYQENP